MRLLSAGIAAAALCAITTATQSAQLENTKIDNWSVGAYSHDRTGQFSHCATSVRYQSGTYLVFSIGRSFTWSMGLANPAWRLTRGATYDLQYAIDNGQVYAAKGTAITTSLVELPLHNSNALFENFRKGHALRVQAAGSSFTFNLASSASALAVTFECTKKYVSPPQTADNANPFAPKPAPGTSRRNDDARAEATLVLANVLSSAGIQGFRVVSPEEVQIHTHDMWWAAPGLIGSLKIVDAKVAKTPEDVAALVMAADASSCKGVFASARYPTENDTARLMTACDGSKDKTQYDYSVAARPKGGFYVFGVGTTEKGKPEELKDTGARLHEAAVRSYSRP